MVFSLDLIHGHTENNCAWTAGHTPTGREMLFWIAAQLNRASHTMTSIASRPTRLKHVSCLPVYEDKMGNCNLQFGLWVIVYSIFNRPSMWTSSQMSHDRQICFYAKFLFDFMISSHGRISLRVLNNFSLFTCKSIENRPLHSNFFAEESWIDSEHVSTSPLTLITHDENPADVIFSTCWILVYQSCYCAYDGENWYNTVQHSKRWRDPISSVNRGSDRFDVKNTKREMQYTVETLYNTVNFSEILIKDTP